MDLINKGMRHLDAVKHCQDKMTPQMREHDYTMRDTPPAEWTESQVIVAEVIDRYVNGDLYKTSPWIPVSVQPPPQEELDALPSWDQCLVHRLLYYVHSRPVLTDHEYDMLERRACQELELLCMAHPLDLPGSDLESSYPAPLRVLARRFLS